MIHRVFAYGSNMHVPDLREWMRSGGYEDARVLDSRAALLHDWELVWNYRSPARDGGAANVRPKAGVVLPGVVLHLDHRGLEALDHKEGHPNRYSRGEAPVRVSLLNGEANAPAWLYVVTEEHRRAQKIAPRKQYLDLVIEGAVHHDLPDWHIDALKRTAAEP